MSDTPTINLAAVTYAAQESLRRALEVQGREIAELRARVETLEARARRVEPRRELRRELRR